MPRKSVAALAVVTPLHQQRPEPPDHLCEDAADEWRRVVAARAADWFGQEQLSHLASYCQHLATARLRAEAERPARSDAPIIRYIGQRR